MSLCGLTVTINAIFTLGANINAKDAYLNTPLTEASLRGHLKTVQFLLGFRPLEIDIDAQNNEDRTALHKAAYNGHSEIIKALLAAGADPRKKDINSNKAVHYAQDKQSKFYLKVWDPKRTERI